MIPRKGALKYVIFGNGEFAIVFPAFLNHRDAAISLRDSILMITDAPATSAGFCALKSDGKWSVWGKSVSLGVNGDETDAAILDEWYECHALNNG